MTGLAVVTATIDYDRALACLGTWRGLAYGDIHLYVVDQSGTRPLGWTPHGYQVGLGDLRRFGAPGILGVVPAFAIGVQQALDDGAEVIACFHDDLEIDAAGAAGGPGGAGWDQDVLRLFKACPRAGLCGFGGARGLGSDDLYDPPYDPMKLARQGFGSNMRHAEAHGVRWESAQPVACLDGFSQIGTRDFWEGIERGTVERGEGHQYFLNNAPTNLFALMSSLGVTHHFYDGMLGCYAKRLGYQTWFLPVRCHHHGGLTAVADPRYHDWANRFRDTLQRRDTHDAAPYPGSGDQMFWEAAHRIGYQEFRDVLPLRT